MDAKAMGIILIALLIHVSAVEGLKCYACLTNKDWSKCNDIQKEITCAAGISHCLKLEVTASGGGVDSVSYTKLCSDACDKKSLTDCNTQKEGVTVKCNINCCKGDLCNGSSVPLVSGAVIIACALVSAMFVLMQ